MTSSSKILVVERLHPLPLLFTISNVFTFLIKSSFSSLAVN